MISMNLVVLLYLVASVCFIQALKGLSHPTTSIRGNRFGMAGMAIAALTTVALIVKLAGQMGAPNPWFGLSYVLVGLLIGGGLVLLSLLSWAASRRNPGAHRDLAGEKQ